MNKSTLIPDYVFINFNLPIPMREYMFHPKRKWRLDFAWPEFKLAVEIEGGVFTKGRHTRPKGFIGDIEKYNELTLYGWKLLRFIPSKIDYEMIKYALYIDSI
ncbi:MAG: endonuclease domain-containing protein [Porphyromonadaceae bacterium]|nr:endonuclease domain-containing protein [Porphyromonadaceae bacterium]